MTKKPWTTKDGDIEEVTEEMFALMRPMREVDPEFIARFEEEKRKRGRPSGRTKSVVSLSLDKDIISTLRASGEGWQSRVNALLRAAIGLDSNPHP